MIRLSPLLLFLLVGLNAFAQPEIEAQADQLSEQGKYQESIALYRECMIHVLAKKDLQKYLDLAIKQAVDYQQKGDFQIGLDSLQKIIKRVSPSVLTDSLLALAYHKMGVICYEMSQYEEAIVHFHQALDIRKEVYPENHIDIIKGYRNIGTAYIRLRNFREARNFLQQSLDLHQKVRTSDMDLLASTHMDLGDVISIQRDFERARTHLELALAIRKDIHKEELWLLDEIYNRLFLHYERQSDTQRMKFYSNELIDLFESFDEVYRSDSIVLADAYHNKGTALEMEDQLEPAIRFYQKSLDFNTQLTGRDSERADNFNNLAIIYTKQVDFANAMAAVEQALVINRKKENKLGIAAGLNNKATIYASQGKPKEALPILQEAIQYLAPDFHSDDIYTNPNIQEGVVGDKTKLIEYLAEKADMFSDLANQEDEEKNLIAASDIYLLIIELAGQTRRNLESDQPKLQLQEELKNYLAKGVGVNYRLYELTDDKLYLERGFRLVEQSKAVTLLDALTEKNAQERSNIPEALVEQEYQIKWEIARLELDLFKENDHSNRLQASWLKQKRQQELLIDSFKVAHPDYYELKYQNATTTTDQLQSALEGTSIEYFIGADYLYAFIIQPKEVYWLRWIPPSPIVAQIKSLQEAVRNEKCQQPKQATDCDVFSDLLYELYKDLILPIELSVVLTEKLWIIPDGVLGYLPFELLLKERPSSGRQFKGHAYLLIDHRISYAYSATSLMEVRNKSKSRAEYELLAMAPTFLRPKAGNPLEKRDTIDFPPLKFNVEEVESITTFLEGRSLIGTNATKAAFIRQAPDYRILHLATHGLANDRAGDFSFLAFTDMVYENPNDDRIYNRELYQLPLNNTEMVVLSACETGLGDLKQGEGIISLARGFTYAGAKSIVASLWNANDVTTKNLMLSFYQHLRAGKHKEEALRQAKLDLINNSDHAGAHPFYWAGFIAIGDMKAIVSPFYWSWQFWTGIILIAILITAYLNIKRKKVNA